MKETKFSILIPVYNVGNYIEECIQSAIKQNYHNYDVIIIDDGSTDNSGMICDQYASDRVKVFHQENKGLMITRRRSIQIADGDYCVFLDGDDILELDTLAKLNEAIINNDLDIVIFEAFLFNNDDLSHKWKRKPAFETDKLFTNPKEKEELYYKLLLTNEINNLATKTIKRELLKNDPINYEEIGTSSMGEDLIQSIYPITKADRIQYISTYLYNYRQSPTGMTRNIKMDALDKEYNRYNKKVCELRIKYAHYWGLDVDNEIYKNTLIYVMNHFKNVYLKCSTFEERRCWTKMNWAQLVPDESVAAFYNHKFKLSLVQRLQIFFLLNNKQYYMEGYRLLREIKHHLKFNRKKV